jgi:hypothetical protein
MTFTTYVASPTFCPDAASRRTNLKQCLDVARRRLDETSGASETEKNAALVASAVSAGWEENEVRDLLQGSSSGFAPELGQQPRPIGLVPSSSL